MNNKIKVFSTFSGIGMWEFALERFIDFENVGFSEMDKFAIQAYELNHDGKNYGDITKINPNELPDFDLFVSSPPCQAFSVAGKGQGADDDKGRGRLFEDAIEIMRVKQPKWAVYENVKGLVSKKHTAYFDYIIRLMKDAGYVVNWKVLNTKEHGIPQNRERVFIVCIREDIDSSYFQFPEKQELKLFLKDILENEVDEKYYLAPERVEKLLSSVKQPELSKKESCAFDVYNKKIKDDGVSPALTLPHHNSLRLTIPVLTPDRLNKRQNGRRFKTDGEPMFTLNTQDRHGIMQVNNPVRIGNIYGENRGTGFAGNVWDKNGISPTLNTMQGGNRQPFVANNELQIRKLTPRECFRLQGDLKDEIKLEGLSNSQQYKIAGNALTIDVAEKLLRNLLL